MTTLLKVENSSSLARDVSSHAIINTSDTDYENYKKKREASLKQKMQIDSQVKEIESIKCEISEIKLMLMRLLSKDNGK